MKDASRFLIECDRTVGLPTVLKLVAVLEADDGITVRELSQLLHCSGQTAKGYIRVAAERGWLLKTIEFRDTAAVYRRTSKGNLLTERLTC